MVVSTVGVPFVDLGRQYAQVGDAIEQRVLDVLRSVHYISGAEVIDFEDAFARYCQTRFAVAVNSGTAALHVALLALGIGPGDEVITVSHTFVATTEAIVATGATPVFVDIDATTCNMDASLIEAAITPRTRAILPVHLYGQLAEMDAIQAIAERHGLPVVEDACQAHGAAYKGQPAGSWGQVACFSFYPSKNLGAAGEGGIAVTNSPELAAKMRQFRDHGQARRYEHEVMGYNYRLPELQAAVLGVKLAYLDEWNEGRKRAAAHYEALLDGVDVQTVHQLPGADSVFHLYVVRTPQRDAMANALTQAGIGCGIHYPIPVHLQTAFRQYGGSEGSLPNTEAAAREVLSLPMFPEIEDQQIELVVDRVREFVGRL